MGKAEENKRQKKTRLLETAFQLFTTKGTAQTSISDIASAAGVGKGTFYLYFRDKNDIEARLIARRADQIFSHALEALKNREDELHSFGDSIIAIVDDVLEQLQNNHLILRFINKNLSWGVFRNAIIDLTTDEDFSCYTALHSLLQQGQEEWNEPDLLLYSIIELTSSTCYSIILKEDPVPMDTYRRYLNQYIRSIIAVHEKKPEHSES
jgi:AcrR family transcriptional regulator